jgi:hypothetical protein
VRRLLPTVFVLVLLAATVAAFALAERLKLQPAPVRSVKIQHTVFSPACECKQRVAPIAFTLRKPTRVTLTMLDAEDRGVSRVVVNKRFERQVSVAWDGRDDEGEQLPEGVYRPKLELHDLNRTILMPNPIRIDVTRPRLRVTRVSTPVISPDGDRRRDYVSFQYSISEKAKVLGYVGERQILESRFQRRQDKLDWSGRRNGKGLPDGVYRVDLVARDPAGNLSAPVRKAIRIRYIEVARRRIVVNARARFGVRVRSDATRFEWRIGNLRRGTARTGLLVLRAPPPGRYWLYVKARGHVDRARLVVRQRR